MDLRRTDGEKTRRESKVGCLSNCNAFPDLVAPWDVYVFKLRIFFQNEYIKVCFS